MQPNSPPLRRDSLRQRILIVAVVIAVIGALAAIAAFVWYPTTLQPNVTLTNTPFVATPCAPLLGGGYANRFNTTLTLVNTGRADGDAVVQFLLGNFSLGYRFYLVSPGSQVTDAVSIIWEVHSSPTACGPLDNPGPPAISLASVTRSPPIDPRTLIFASVIPGATVVFAGGMLGGLQHLARRRGISLFEDLRGEGWGIALLAVFAANMFAGLLTAVLTVPYNYPVDWTPLLVYVPVYSALGIGTFILAWRAVLRAARDEKRPRV